ncbi:hypothetical protein [Apilactobacillus xinyiensis]|uniref:hypothetical protein n=1 Tax=Apilactobacillus xinyiensis TaxID=2841032 RepID=UPI001C7CA663|nr:hypothetical protein [Apilactobacillus xinyiensis]MCL0330800.1 hypothetical protein [Apilactobacillus xinyiensis]
MKNKYINSFLLILSVILTLTIANQKIEANGIKGDRPSIKYTVKIINKSKFMGAYNYRHLIVRKNKVIAVVGKNDEKRDTAFTKKIKKGWQILWVAGAGGARYKFVVTKLDKNHVKAFFKGWESLHPKDADKKTYIYKVH